MEKRLKAYVTYLETLVRQKEQGILTPEQCLEQKQNILVQIGFFQHERLIHLIVTVLFAILTVLSLIGCVISANLSLLGLVALLIVLLIPYIRHYYILENGVQRMYRCYDALEDDWQNTLESSV